MADKDNKRAMFNVDRQKNPTIDLTKIWNDKQLRKISIEKERSKARRERKQKM